MQRVAKPAAKAATKKSLATIVALVGPAGSATFESVRIENWFRSYSSSQTVRKMSDDDRACRAKNVAHTNKYTVRYTRRMAISWRKIVKTPNWCIDEGTNDDDICARFLVSSQRDLKGNIMFDGPSKGQMYEFIQYSNDVFLHPMDTDIIARAPKLQSIADILIVSAAIIDQAPNDDDILYDDCGGEDEDVNGALEDD